MEIEHLVKENEHHFGASERPYLLKGAISKKRKRESRDKESSCEEPKPDYSCRLCDISFEDVKSQKSHFKEVHNRITEKKLPNIEGGKFGCKHCEISFVDVYSLKSHLSQEHNLHNVSNKYCEVYCKSETIYK